MLLNKDATPRPEHPGHPECFQLEPGIAKVILKSLNTCACTHVLCTYVSQICACMFVCMHTHVDMCECTCTLCAHMCIHVFTVHMRVHTCVFTCVCTHMEELSGGMRIWQQCS